MVRWAGSLPRGRRPWRRSGERGYALAAALLVMLLVAVGLSLLAGAIALRQRDLREDATRIHLVAMTDAGLAEALAVLAADPSFAGVASSPYARGELGSAVERSGPGRRVIEVWASIGELGRTIRAEVVIVAGRPRVETWQVVASGVGGDGGSIRN